MASNSLLHLPRTQVLRRAYPALGLTRRLPPRPFHSTPGRSTDGVFKALTSMRVRKPWIEALREKKEADKHPVAEPAQCMKADLTPKKMSDSYTSVVLPLSVSAPEYKTLIPSLNLPMLSWPCSKIRGFSILMPITLDKYVPAPC